MENRFQFFFKQLFRGVMSFVIIIALFILLQEEIALYKEQIVAIGDNMLLLVLVFSCSEVVLSLIPPELFMMIWKTKGVLSEYVINLSLFTCISYLSGILNYGIGHKLLKVPAYKKYIDMLLSRYHYLRRYVGFSVAVAAMTPIPFSVMCIMAGTVGYPIRTFFLIASTRLVRFSFYGWMVWSSPEWFL